MRRTGRLPQNPWTTSANDGEQAADKGGAESLSDIHRMTRRTDIDVTAKTHTTSAAGSSEPGFDALERMNRDWEVLGRDLRAADHVTRWSQEEPEFADARTPQDVVDILARLGSQGDWGQHDRTMAALLRKITGDSFDGQLAWRIAARVLMPKVILMAKPQVRPGLDWDVVFSTMLSALFEILRTYPLERRGRAILANVSMDTLALALATLAADYDDRGELVEPGHSLEPLAGDPNVFWVKQETSDPQVLAELAELLVRAAELEIVPRDEPELAQGEARAALLDLVMWAVDVEVLKPCDAQRITDYYYLGTSADANQPYRTTLDMGAEGARIRQRASRAVHRALRAFLDDDCEPTALRSWEAMLAPSPEELLERIRTILTGHVERRAS
ncbi:MAG: hypothetical protein JO362_02750 [Streptomycetaceae bacterium]|nr:hypothetical protein [Streptomycetaceae bacterium]